MPDWLEELREEKKQAIARTQGTRNAGMQYASVADRLQAEQRQLAALVQSIGIEPLLQQFVDEGLRDHPLFVDSTLNRTVIGRDSNESPAREEKEGAPWSGPIEGNFLPPALDLGGGRTVSRVDWRLHLNYRQQYSEQLQLNDILITVSAQGVQVNNEPLAEPAAETFKTALVSAFRNSTQPSLPPGVRRARRKRHPTTQAHQVFMQCRAQPAWQQPQFVIEGGKARPAFRANAIFAAQFHFVTALRLYLPRLCALRTQRALARRATRALGGWRFRPIRLVADQRRVLQHARPHLG